MKALALILIVLGIIGVVYGGITWTHPHQVADLGPVQITSTKHESIPLPPVAGAILLVAGAALFFSSNRRVA